MRASLGATLSIVSLLTNVIYATDAILTFGDEAVAQAGGPLYTDDVGLNLIFGTCSKWWNGSSGFSTSAGFPPFQGPVGVVLTNETADMTAFRPTLVVGMRIFTADGNTERDPADYTLEGLLDGNTFHTIACPSVLKGKMKLRAVISGGRIADPRESGRW